MGYNKRISRPGYYQLNSNIQYDNRYQYEGGNPLLRPTIKQNFDLNKDRNENNENMEKHLRDVRCHALPRLLQQ